jgi:hypothetical protein
VPLDRLITRTRVRRLELLTFLEQQPHLVQVDAGWVNAMILADGLALVHAVSAAEREAGLLAADDDLAFWALLTQNGLPLQGGGQVTARALLDLPVAVATHLPPAFGLVGQALVGPDGWLDDVRAGQLVEVRLQRGALSVRTVAPLPHQPDRVAVLHAAAAAAIERATARYLDGDEPSPTADLSILITEMLLDQPELMAEPLPPLRDLLPTAGWEAFGGRLGLAGTAWNVNEVKGLPRSQALTAMRALHTVLTYDPTATEDVGTLQAVDDLARRLTAPDVLTYVAGAVEQRAATIGTSFAAVTDRLATVATSPKQRAAAAMLAARAAEGAGDSDTAEALVHQVLHQWPDLTPALLDAGEYAACRGDLPAAERHLQRSGHPLADALRSAVRDVLQARPASGAGRNRPCPCGSGRKFKLCCEVSTPPPLAARAPLLYALLATFVQRPAHQHRLAHLITASGADDSTVLLCLDLLLTHDGAAERFRRQRGAWLREDERDLIDTWARQPLEVFEIRQVTRGLGVTCRRLPGGDVVELRDRLLSTCVHRLDLFLGRILTDGSRPKLLAIPTPVNRQRRRELLDLLAGNPTSAQVAAFLGPEPAPHLVNGDGHDFLDAELVLCLPGPAPEAWGRLSAQLVPDGPDILELREERKGQIVRLGTIREDGSRWTLTANSRERLDVIESIVRAEIPSARELSRRADPIGDTPPPGGPPPGGRKPRTLVLDSFSTSPSEVLAGRSPHDHWLDQTRRAWLDTPDSLGVTPREAAAAGGEPRRELESMLDDMEWTDARQRQQGQAPTMDVARIRAELGIPG